MNDARAIQRLALLRRLTRVVPQIVAVIGRAILAVEGANAERVAVSHRKEKNPCKWS